MEEMKDRAEILADYIIDNGCTVRAAAAEFGLSKSTVHKDVTERLRSFSPALYRDVRRVLDRNREERHMRGGLATREKYMSMRLVRENFSGSQDVQADEDSN